MPPRRLPALGRAQHQEAVARRLALLSDELADLRPSRVAEHSEPLAGRAEAARDELVARVPVPGRHAARREGAWPTVVPETLRGPVALAPMHLSVVALLLVAALAVTCWWVVRGDEAEVRPAEAAQEPGGLVAVPPAAAGSASPAAAAAAETTVTVDVAGRVRRPGITVLPTGARVVDAVEAAGGPRRGVDLTSLNLARVLVDGEQIVVGSPVPTTAAGDVPPAATAGPLLSLNTATPTQLEELPEVGPVTAAAIVTWREQHGGFTSVDQLLEVEGIGEKTLETIAPHVTL